MISASSSSATNIPGTCSSEQRAAIGKQLPYFKQCRLGWHPCSFTLATWGCQNPIIARKFFLQSKTFEVSEDRPFFGVVLGWKDYGTPIDLLAIGSRDRKFSNIKGKSAKAGFDERKNCRPQINVFDNDPRPAHVLVVDLDNPNEESSVPTSLKTTYKDTFLYDDNQLKVVPINTIKLMRPNRLSNVIRRHYPGNKFADDQPIHMLELGFGGLDHLILTKLMPTMLKNVRYLHFEYNKDGTWLDDDATLFGLIEKLKNDGFMCYWSGDEDSGYGLWQITGCFLDHYKYKHWARVACVNESHDDVKELANQMKLKFEETITQDKVFDLQYASKFQK